ncbi:MAG: hypothetical protein U0791_25475 [Gemmataceae bacterium]
MSITAFSSAFDPISTWPLARMSSGEAQARRRAVQPAEVPQIAAANKRRVIVRIVSRFIRYANLENDTG